VQKKQPRNDDDDATCGNFHLRQNATYGKMPPTAPATCGIKINYDDEDNDDNATCGNFHLWQNTICGRMPPTAPATCGIKINYDDDDDDDDSGGDKHNDGGIGMTYSQ
jgi:hypothetical protein